MITAQTPIGGSVALTRPPLRLPSPHERLGLPQTNVEPGQRVDWHVVPALPRQNSGASDFAHS